MELQNAHSSLISFIQNHSKADSTSKPKIKFYSGVQGIKQAFRDMPWDKKDEEGYLMWPLQDMLDTLGEDFLKWHAAPRFKYNIYMLNYLHKLFNGGKTAIKVIRPLRCGGRYSYCFAVGLFESEFDVIWVAVIN